MSSLSPAPPVRHGLCALYLRIGGTRYKIHSVKPAPGGYRVVWIVRKLDPAAPAATYSVAVPKGEDPACTCPDHEINGAVCKHVMALAALGLIRKPRAARPQTPRQPSRKGLRLHDKTASAHLAEVATEGPPPLYPAPAEAAAGFRSSVQEHIAALRGGVQ